MPDPRAAQGVLGRVVRGLDRFNRRHPWSHNEHFHGWVLRRLPSRCDRALDIGCGQGALTVKLAQRVARVDAVDIDEPMAAATARRTVTLPGVRVRQAALADVEPGADYDVITMIAVLHHLEPVVGLRQVRALLRPGGRLLAVGLCRVNSPADLAWDLVSAVLNPLMSAIRHPRRVEPAAGVDPMPVRDPQLTFDQTRAIATRVLPGLVMRRRLFRYTLEWTSPGGGGDQEQLPCPSSS